MNILENELLAVSIAAKGAELQSITHKQYGLEYMWNGDPAFWGKKSPVLFPVVGGLKNNQYQYKGKSYSLGRHGFARDRNFTVIQESSNHIRFTLEADDESRKVYPFDFRFSLIYILNDNRLTVTYEVENTGTEPLLFSVGAHPAFAVPLTKETDFTDYYLQFSDVETTGKWPLSADGLIENASIPFLQQTSRLPLTKELFYGDALVFKQLRSNSIAILNNHNQHGLKLGYEGFPYMGIWSSRDANFVCIEPWCGIADHVTASGELSEKEGINQLVAGKSFLRSWYIEVF